MRNPTFANEAAAGNETAAGVPAKAIAGAAACLLAAFALAVACGAGCAAAAAGGAAGPAAALPPLRVEGPRLVAGGGEVRLRGVNWGWWHDAGTVYTEREAERMAQWGANLIRLPFSYKDVESDARDGTLDEAKVRDVDEVVGWAARHGLYVILDMHECPGGQTPVAYSDGGGNRLWSDEGCQARYVALWRALAARYRDEPAVAAYELMNEPVTQRRGPAPHMALVRRAAAAVREAAPEKTLVVPGDNWSPARALADGILLDDPNVVYTFHFYEGGRSIRWLRNEGEGENARDGTTDGWVPFEVEYRSLPDDRSFTTLLRTERNAGTVWFDDLEIVDAGTGETLRRFSFDAGAKGFRPERDPASRMVFDPAVGRGAPGSLRVDPAPDQDYNGWEGAKIWTSGKERSFRIRGWMRLQNATGRTYAAASVRGLGDADIDPDDIARRIAPAADFARRHGVPVWVGEFSDIPDAADPGYQARATRERIRLFERLGFHWTFWNYREPHRPGIQTMAIQEQAADGSDLPINDSLLDALRDGFAGRLP